MLLEAENLSLRYWRREGRKKVYFPAVDGVSFHIREGECLGLIGESGSGKSTVSRIVAGLLVPDAGTVKLGTAMLTDFTPRSLSSDRLRSEVQIVFQDPDASLNPSFSVGRCIADGLLRLNKNLSSGGRAQRVAEVMALVGLDRELKERLPHQLSGGQKARVNIARAIATSPKLLILDEPTAALDVSVQAAIMKLLDTLRHELKMSYLFVTHDLDIVRLISDRIAVMQNGRFVEEGTCKSVLSAPQHPYTKSLLEAVMPRSRPKLVLPRHTASSVESETRTRGSV